MRPLQHLTRLQVSAILITIISIWWLFSDAHAQQRRVNIFGAQNKDSADSTKGNVVIDIADALGRPLDSRVAFHRAGRAFRVLEVPGGKAELTMGEGNYEAYVYVYDRGVPILVDIQDVHIRKDFEDFLMVNLLEGSSGRRPLSAFDKDHDQAMDRVELAAGTDPEDPSRIPGIPRLDWDSPVLSSEGNWYRGELHAHSEYGGGSESVAELVARAEALGLDFLAIADRNTMAASNDPGFHSDKVVLIPAMEWGDDRRGVAIVYGPRTLPHVPATGIEAQALLVRTRAQGGIFAIAHPCFPIAGWNWGLRHANAIEAWCRDWNLVPPMNPGHLTESSRAREDGILKYSIAEAAATPGLSANGQSTLFWNLEMDKGLRAAVIAGSNSSSPKVPLGSPITYVYAREKSVMGILQGLRKGRTFVSRGLDGPTINFGADVLNDGTLDTPIGGIIPILHETRFEISIVGAKNRRMEIIRDGLPIRSTKIPTDDFYYEFKDTPEVPSVYRIRVIDRAGQAGFSSIELYAMTSAIFAHGILATETEEGVDAWIRIQNEYLGPEDFENFVPPTDAAPEWIAPRRR